MPLNYTIDNVSVTEYNVDITQQMVTVQYKEMSGENVIKKGVAYFYVTLPENPTPQDFQLPLTYAQTLLDLASDASGVIETRLGV